LAIERESTRCKEDNLSRIGNRFPIRRKKNLPRKTGLACKINQDIFLVILPRGVKWKREERRNVSKNAQGQSPQGWPLEKLVGGERKGKGDRISKT